MIAAKIQSVLNGNSRSAKFKKNIVYLIIIQVLSVFVSFLLVPITLNVLGPKEYGIWITLVNIISWSVFFDLGLSHGLRNKYVEAKAQGKMAEAKKYVSTTFFSLVIITSAIFCIILLLNRFVTWSTLLNAPPNMEAELRILGLVLILSFNVRLILSLATTLLTADQEPSKSSFINFSGHLLSLICVFVVTRLTAPSLLKVGVALTVCQIFPLFIAFLLLFKTKYKELYPSLTSFSKVHLISILSLGGRFFLIQLTALVLFQTNNILIAKTVGLEQVAEFNIAFKYLNVAYIIFTTFINPLWSASTDAFAKGDINWITSSMKKINIVWWFLMVVGVFLVILSPFAYEVWIGDTFNPNYWLLFLTLAYFVFLAKSHMYRSFMNGVGKISLQFYVTVFQSILHIPLAYALGREFGIYGVLSVMVVWPLMNSIWERIQFQKIISKTGRGVWIQ